MSLINDALRKAQKQRTGEMPALSSMPAIGGESAARIAKRTRPAGFYTLLIRLGAVVALLSVVIIGGVVLLRKKAGPVEVTTLPTQKAAVQPSAAVQTPAPQPQATAAQPAATSTFVVPVVVPPTPAPVNKTVAQTEPPQTVAPITPKPEPVTAKPEPVKPAVPAKMEAKAINFIESLKVVGIRASTTDSKVLMNDRVYRIGNIVEHEMGIKLTGITANSLTFEDERGGSYTRTF